MLLALVLLLIGLWLAGGGVYLIVLGGSPYYAIAGLLLIVTSVLMFRGEQVAIWIYVVDFGFTLIWALYESGFNGWAQVPRLLGPVIMLVLVLLTNPVLRSIRPFAWSGPRPPRGVVAAIVVLLGLGAAIPLVLQHGGALAQDARFTAGLPIPIDTVNKTPGDDWPVYGGSNLELRYSALDQITPQNASKLEKVWEYRTGDLPENQPHPELVKDKYSPETTPIKIGNMLYLCSARDIILAVEAGSGKEDWRYDPQISNGHVPYGATCRGVSYYSVANAVPDQACANRIVEGTMDARIIEVDAKTGKPCTDFGSNGNVDLASSDTCAKDYVPAGTGAYPSTDMHGSVRPAGGAVDAGADESG
jgi:quinoprotein glucose dehydrogenase